MFEALRKRLRRPPAEPCLHETLLFDWYKDIGIATCGTCAEVFLASELGDLPDWKPIPRNGGFDGP